MRALGDAMGIEHSVAYRHFSNKRALVDAVVDHALAALRDDTQNALGDPRERVLNTLMGFRTMVRDQPHLGPAIMERQFGTPTGQALIRSVVAELASMGLDGRQLVCCYQALASLTIGSAVYDYSRPPGEVSDRRALFRSLGIDAFTAEADDDHALASVPEEAFERSVTAVLDTFTSAPT